MLGWTAAYLDGILGGLEVQDGGVKVGCEGGFVGVLQGELHLARAHLHYEVGTPRVVTMSLYE